MFFGSSRHPPNGTLECCLHLGHRTNPPPPCGLCATSYPALAELPRNPLTIVPTTSRTTPSGIDCIHVAFFSSPLLDPLVPPSLVRSRQSTEKSSTSSPSYTSSFISLLWVQRAVLLEALHQTLPHCYHQNLSFWKILLFDFFYSPGHAYVSYASSSGPHQSRTHSLRRQPLVSSALLSRGSRIVPLRLMPSRASNLVADSHYF